MRIQPTNHNSTMGNQNEIRENTMMTHNDQAKAQFPLSLNGRGARGEGVLRYAKTSRSLAALLLATAWLLVPGVATAQTSCDDAVFPAEMTCTPDGSAVTLDNDDPGAFGGINLSAVDGYTFNNNTGAVWRFESDVSDLGAGEINNAGTIRLGPGRIVSAPGTTFTGLEGSVLRMDRVSLTGEGQSSCDSPTVASCLDLSGGATQGQTEILILPSQFPGNPLVKTVDKFLNPGIVLVDVSGGSSDADDFVLSPDSFAVIDPGGSGGAETVEFYAEDARYGAVLETGGLFDYALLYNPDTQQHLLASVPQQEGVEYVSFIHEALSIWHTTSDAVAGRQADLRYGNQRGGWVRIVSDQTERDSTSTLTTHGNSFTYDNDSKLSTKSLIAGYDLTAADSHVIGAHAGIIAARQEYRAGSSSRDETRGATFGAYASWWNEAGLTLDGTLNANMLTIDHKPGRDFETSESNVRSIGLSAEAGWRFPLSEAFYVQPLANVAYVRANIEDLDLRHYDADFENADSQRAALGLRLGGGTDLTGDQFSHIKYWLTARAWEEFAGDDVHVAFEVEGGEDLVIKDDISGSFEEVGLGASLTNAEGDISVFLSGNLRSGDDTDSSNVTIGARMNW